MYKRQGQYTEIYFPSKGVRYIAINDNVDTINGESELAPVSYTHLDVYKRQGQWWLCSAVFYSCQVWAAHASDFYGRYSTDENHFLSLIHI